MKGEQGTMRMCSDLGGTQMWLCLSKLTEVFPSVPHGSDFNQTGADNLQVRSPLTPLIPTLLKDVPQLINESKVRRRLRFVRSNSFQYRIADLVPFPTLIRYVTTKHLLHRELSAREELHKHTPRR